MLTHRTNNRTNEANISITRLCELTRWSDLTVRTALRELKSAGLIDWKRTGRASVYSWQSVALTPVQRGLRQVVPSELAPEKCSTNASRRPALAAELAATWGIALAEFNSARRRVRYPGLPDYQDVTLSDAQRTAIASDMESLASAWAVEGEEREAAVRRVAQAYWVQWLDRSGTLGNDGKAYLVKRRHDPVELFHPRWRDHETIVGDLASRTPRKRAAAPLPRETAPDVSQTRESAAAIAELLGGRRLAGGMR